MCGGELLLPAWATLNSFRTHFNFTPILFLTPTALQCHLELISASQQFYFAFNCSSLWDRSNVPVAATSSILFGCHVGFIQVPLLFHLQCHLDLMSENPLSNPLNITSASFRLHCDMNSTPHEFRVCFAVALVQL